MLSDDLLKGVKAIAEYLGPHFTERAVYHLVEKKALPIFRLQDSTTIYARKSELDRHFSAQKPQPEPEAAEAEPQANAA